MFLSTAQISESMFFGDIQVQTETETLAPDYSTRTMKVTVIRMRAMIIQSYSHEGDRHQDQSSGQGLGSDGY
jgi:hypothetical protein